MSRSMSDDARPEQWQMKAASLIVKLWRKHEEGYVFLANRKPGFKKWKEHSFKLPVSKQKLVDHFREYHRDEYDHYFCPNAFSIAHRLTEHAYATPFSWADIDDADPEKFNPAPGILIRTSPGRYQGIWSHRNAVSASKAAQHSRELAYRFGADKNGWSVTKYLRVPYTINHKREYDKPPVKLVRQDWSVQPRRKLNSLKAAHLTRRHNLAPIKPDGFLPWENSLSQVSTQLTSKGTCSHHVEACIRL